MKLSREEVLHISALAKIGVTDEDVDFAEAIDGLGGDALEVGTAGHVGGRGFDAAAGGGADGLRGGLEGAFCASAEEQIGAGAREALGDCPTDSFASASHQGDAARQVKRGVFHSPPSWSRISLSPVRRMAGGRGGWEGLTLGVRSTLRASRGGREE